MEGGARSRSQRCTFGNRRFGSRQACIEGATIDTRRNTFRDRTSVCTFPSLYVTEQAVSYACLRVHRTFANYYESRREAVVARYAIITT